MNINLVAVALSPSSKEKTRKNFEYAVDFAEELLPSPKSQIISKENVFIYNANRVEATWDAPSVYQVGNKVIAVSQPPIPVRENIPEGESDGYWELVSKYVEQGDFSALLPNHFGVVADFDKREVKIWSDNIGLGRCYYVQTNDVIAASNHIGILFHFINGKIEIDEKAVGRFAAAGWFMLNDSPYKAVRRLQEGTFIEVTLDKSVYFMPYRDTFSLVGPRNHDPDFDSVTEEFRTVAKNLNRMATRTPTVYLSGGRDSRMTAGVWLSSGNEANVMTLGTLPREAEVAKKLMATFKEHYPSEKVSHKITVPGGSDIKTSLETRLRNAFRLWDGDAAPTNMKRDIPTPSGRATIQIGGVGGEIMHGYYYLRPGLIPKIQEMDDPLEHAKRSYGLKTISEFSRQALDEGFADIKTQVARIGLDNYSKLDYLYLTEKLRRWGNQALGSTSAVMLSSPKYIRACFDMVPEDKVNKVFPVSIVERSIPEWSEVEIYKAQKDDSKHLMTRGLTTYQTDPETFWDYLLHQGNHWRKYFDEASMETFMKLVREDTDASPVHESWLNRAIWIEHLYKHCEEINRKLKRFGINDEHEKDTQKQRSIEVNLIESLRTGFYAPSSRDDQQVREILNGYIVFGQEKVSINDEAVFSVESHVEKPYYLALHSLRWADALLRKNSKESDVQEKNKWVNVWEKWWDIHKTDDFKLSRLWGTPLLLQRIRGLALGGKLLDQLPSNLIKSHIEQLDDRLTLLEDAGQAKDAILIRLLLAEYGYAVDRNTLFSEALANHIRVSGGSQGIDAEAFAKAKDRWTAWFDQWDPDSKYTAEFSRYLSMPDFWIHMHQPDGSLAGFGASNPDAGFLGAIPETLYVRSGGAKGDPSPKTFFVDPNGYVSSRSGWGETERKLTEETHWTMLTTPGRGRNAHEDTGRITYMSQGVAWVIDIPGEEFASSDYHSNVSVENFSFRPLSRTSLVWDRSDGVVDEVLMQSRAYTPVAWSRQVAFAKSAYYLVIKDELRTGRDTFNASQDWIINPQVRVEVRSNNSVWLVSGDKKVSITTNTNSSRGVEVDEVIDQGGKRVAHRIRIWADGKSARIVTTIADVIDESQHQVRRLPAEGHNIILDFKDKNIVERFISNKEGSALVSSEATVEESISEFETLQEQGTLTDEEALEQRLATREVIRQAKDRAWADSSSESRKIIIRELIRFAHDNSLNPMRNHGLAAAMIDIASTDLSAEIEQNSLVRGIKRSSLINWSGQFTQPFYKVPVVTSRSSDLLPNINEDSYIWSVDHGQLVASAYISEAPGDCLLVYMHGATDRTRISTPRYERLRSFSQVGEGPAMFITDPTLDLDSRMILSWYLGTEEVNLHLEIAKMIDVVAQKYGVKYVAVVGNSGGGFGALQVTSYLDGADAISVNGQVDISSYTERLASQALWSSFGKYSDTDLTDDEKERWSVIQRAQNHGLKGKVYLHQNTGDDHHFEKHFKPFKQMLKTNGLWKQVTAMEIFEGEGHIAPAPATYEKIVKDWFTLMREEEHRFQGLDS